MCDLSDIGIQGNDLLHPEANESVSPRQDDRSRAAIIRDVAGTLGGLTFFVVAVLLLLCGSRLV